MNTNHVTFLVNRTLKILRVVLFYCVKKSCSTVCVYISIYDYQNFNKTILYKLHAVNLISR